MARSINTPGRKYRGGYYYVAEVDEYGLILKSHGSWLHSKTSKEIKKRVKPEMGGKIKRVRMV